MNPGAFDIVALDHVQLAMPDGGEARARGFYRDVLGFKEDAKPQNLAARGGCWFSKGVVRLHLGVEPDFRAAQKAHPAFRVRGLVSLEARLKQAGFASNPGEPLEGYERLYVDDPFGNRLEFLEPL